MNTFQGSANIFDISGSQHIPIRQTSVFRQSGITKFFALRPRLLCCLLSPWDGFVVGSLPDLWNPETRFSLRSVTQGLSSPRPGFVYSAPPPPSPTPGSHQPERRLAAAPVWLQKPRVPTLLAPACNAATRWAADNGSIVESQCALTAVQSTLALEGPELKRPSVSQDWQASARTIREACLGSAWSCLTDETDREADRRSPGYRLITAARSKRVMFWRPLICEL